MIVPPIPPERFPKPFTGEERAKLVSKIWQQRRQLRGLNKTIRLYRLMWLETSRVRDRFRAQAEALGELGYRQGSSGCWWCRMRARGERWWRA